MVSVFYLPEVGVVQSDSPVNPRFIQRLEALAGFQLTATERAALAAQLQRIIAFVAQLQQLDTTGVEPHTHAVTGKLPLRADVCRPSLPRSEVLAAGPAADGAFFVVPPVFTPGRDAEGGRDG